MVSSARVEFHLGEKPTHEAGQLKAWLGCASMAEVARRSIMLTHKLVTAERAGSHLLLVNDDGESEWLVMV